MARCLWWIPNECEIGHILLAPTENDAVAIEKVSKAVGKEVRDLKRFCCSCFHAEARGYVADGQLLLELDGSLVSVSTDCDTEYGFWTFSGKDAIKRSKSITCPRN